MNCPFCSHPDSQVIDSRQSTYNQINGIRRRRQCQQCNERFSSFEMSIQDLEKVEPATLDSILQKVIQVFKEAPRTNYKAPSSPIVEKSVYHSQDGNKEPTVKPKTPTSDKPTMKLSTKDIKEAMRRARERYADELDASEFDEDDFD